MCEHEPNRATRIIAWVHDTPVGDWLFHRPWFPTFIGEIFCWSCDRVLGLPCGECELQEAD